ncbi:MAG: hypothetical protein FJ220_03275 [Kiritimatiellaceae bacterium]|nr:hypothetical protein [Kiritimatiellaceae bacterium]
MKKVLLTLPILWMALPAMAAIVFDGTNSYSSFTGKPIAKSKLVTNGETTPQLLQEIDSKQMDYTTSSFKPRSGIEEEGGMIIEAEGVYTFQANSTAPGNLGSIRPCTGGNGFALGANQNSQFEYKIKVRTPGTYTIAIDAATAKDKTTLQLYGLKDQETPEGKIPLATWSGYNSGDYNTIIKNYGGINKDTPHFVDVVLDESMTRLVFVMDYNFNTDCFRITGFTPNTTSTAIAQSLPVLITIAVIGVASFAGIFFFLRARANSTRVKAKGASPSMEPANNSEW